MYALPPNSIVWTIPVSGLEAITARKQRSTLNDPAGPLILCEDAHVLSNSRAALAAALLLREHSIAINEMPTRDREVKGLVYALPHGLGEVHAQESRRGLDQAIAVE